MRSMDRQFFLGAAGACRTVRPVLIESCSNQFMLPFSNVALFTIPSEHFPWAAFKSAAIGGGCHKFPPV